MYKLILKNDTNKSKIYIYENEKFVEYYEEKFDKIRTEGNIYLAKVKNIVDGMQSVFLDIGTGEKVMLYIKDLVPKIDSVKGNVEIDFNDIEIKDYIKTNDNILVQIKKDSDPHKGAKATTDIKLIGKYVILLPYDSYITFSNKITDIETQKNLKKILSSINLKNRGLIFRTASEQASKEDIIKEIEVLQGYWKRILDSLNLKETSDKKTIKICGHNLEPKMLLDYRGIIGKLILDLIPSGIELYATDEESKKYLETMEPDLQVKIIKGFTEPEIKRKTWLKSGGFITIDRTEALYAIDVNSGSFLKNSLEETSYCTNLEACAEIAKQIRQQDVGGIIVIDFINMDSKEHQDAILKELEKQMKNDRAKIQICGFTKLGLLELNRKRIFSK